MVYLDYAATAPLLPEVIKKMRAAERRFFANASALHTPGHLAMNEIEKVRELLAELIGANPSEIIFTSGASEANNTVIRTFEGHQIETSPLEHHSIIEAARLYRGNKTPKLYSYMLANNETGEILTLPDVSDGFLHSDLTQALGKIPLNVKKLGLDYATFSAHKIGGPIGVGALYVRKGAGKYIWFIDADDYIANEAIVKLVGRAEATGADMVMMGAERVGRDGEKGAYLSAVDAGDGDYKSRFVRYGMGPWQVLIRREWWLENGFEFRERMIQEDMELMSSLILYTDNFADVDEPLYFYCDNPESVLHKAEFSPHIFDIFPALEGLYQRFERAGAVSRYHDELEWFFIWNLLIDSAKDFGKFPEGRIGFQRSREMLRRYFPGWRRNRFLREKPMKLKIRVRLNYNKR